MVSNRGCCDIDRESDATILHADLDPFSASIGLLLDPTLRGKPTAVGSGVVLAASYAAKLSRKIAAWDPAYMRDVLGAPSR